MVTWIRFLWLLLEDCFGVDGNHALSPLELAANFGNLDQLLGIDLKDTAKAREIIGDGWWDNNRSLLRAKLVLETPTAETEMDLF